MFKKLLIIAILAGFAVLLWSYWRYYTERTSLNDVSTYYVDNTAKEIRAANVVTAIVVTYRGFDTLGEVTILFVSAALIAMFLKSLGKDKSRNPRPASLLLLTAQKLLFPLILLFGVYIFINGHLTPGGGFQGGAVIATGFLLWLIANPDGYAPKNILNAIESISGFGYVTAGLFGLILGLGFLDNRFLGLGTLGHLFSAGIIPVIYSFIGLKVGAELSNVLHHLNEIQNEE